MKLAASDAQKLKNRTSHSGHSETRDAHHRALESMCRLVDQSVRNQAKLVESILDRLERSDSNYAALVSRIDDRIEMLMNGVEKAPVNEEPVDCELVASSIPGIIRWFRTRGEDLYASGHVFFACTEDEVVFHVNLLYTWLGSLYHDRFDFSQKRAKKDGRVKITPKILEEAIKSLGGTKFDTKNETDKATVQKLMTFLPLVSNNRLVTYADALFRVSYSCLDDMTRDIADVPPTTSDPAASKFGQHSLGQQNSKVRMSSDGKGGLLVFGTPLDETFVEAYPSEKFFKEPRGSMEGSEDEDSDDSSTSTRPTSPKRSKKHSRSRDHADDRCGKKARGSDRDD